MPNLADIGLWISGNEQLLSGLAALIVLAGVILSPSRTGVLHLFARRGKNRASTTAAEPATKPAPPAAPTEPLLAVLAFDNLSSDPEMQFFTDGVSEEIIQRLSRGAKLKVIGRMSSFQCRGERKATSVWMSHRSPRATSSSW